MKNLIKSVVVIGACLSAALAMAQKSGSASPQMPSAQQMDKMMAAMKDAHKKAVNSIGLTADQKKKVAAADARHMDKLYNMQKALMKRGAASRNANDPAMRKAVNEATAEGKAWQSELKSAMGESKYKAYQTAMQKEMQKVFKQLMGSGSGKRGG
ncbi:MAG: hypothetical protein KF857_12370 [Fimbriimonadaceae bacterium]|nr:hypothetical protein [Fimbriimonadaceae bacterium]